MADEELNRKFDAVADHLATFAVGMQRLEEAQAQAAEAQAQAAEAQARAAERAGRVEHRLDRVERVLKLAVRAGLRERRARREQDERITALIAAQAAMIDAQARTDAVVNSLAGTVERLAKNGDGRASE